jgi:hypothetical protein
MLPDRARLIMIEVTDSLEYGQYYKKMNSERVIKQ